MSENTDDVIDLERLSDELEKYEKLVKDGEEGDQSAGESCLESSSLELSATSSPTLLDKYLMSVAKTGNPILPWKKLHNFMHHKIDSILGHFYEKYGIEDIESQNLPPFNYFPAKEKLLQHFDTFSGAPFTIQRLCELLVDPGRHYKRTDKLLRGLEKIILVVSTIGRLSADCSNPQQRSMLFNGLQITTFRPFRPPLPEHATKFTDMTPLFLSSEVTSVASTREKIRNALRRKRLREENEDVSRADCSEDVEMKDDDDDVAGVVGSAASAGRLNGDDSDLLDEDEASFEDECLKHSMDEQDEDVMDEMESSVRARLNSSDCDDETEDVCADDDAANGGDHFHLSVNRVIMRRKRKEEHIQQTMRSKRIRMEQIIRVHQQSKNTRGKATKEQHKTEKSISSSSSSSRLPITPDRETREDTASVEHIDTDSKDEPANITTENVTPTPDSSEASSSVDASKESDDSHEGDSVTDDRDCVDAAMETDGVKEEAEEAASQAREDDQNLSPPATVPENAEVTTNSKKTAEQKCSEKNTKEDTSSSSTSSCGSRNKSAEKSEAAAAVEESGGNDATAAAKTTSSETNKEEQSTTTTPAVPVSASDETIVDVESDNSSGHQTATPTEEVVVESSESEAAAVAVEESKTETEEEQSSVDDETASEEATKTTESKTERKKEGTAVEAAPVSTVVAAAADADGDDGIEEKTKAPTDAATCQEKRDNKQTNEKQKSDKHE